jgi:hypothetical protein
MRDDTAKRPYQVMVRMDRETRDRLEAEAKERGRSLSETGFLVIREHLGLDVPEATAGPAVEQLAILEKQMQTVVSPLLEQLRADQRRMQEQLDKLTGKRR